MPIINPKCKKMETAVNPAEVADAIINPNKKNNE